MQLQGYRFVSAPLSETIEFLTAEFEAGKWYSALDSYCSAVSSTHPAVERHLIGQ